MLSAAQRSSTMTNTIPAQSVEAISWARSRCASSGMRSGSSQTTWATAHRWFRDSDRVVLFAELDDAVGRVHGLRFAAFGELLPSGAVRAASSYGKALSERAAKRIADRSHVELFQTVTERHRRALDAVGPPGLTHEDLNPSNLLVERREQTWHLAGVLDLDSAWAGNPESDLARLELWRGMMHPRFWHAYAAARPVSDSYTSRRALLQLLWCLEYARPTTDHNAVTAVVCDELGIAPVVFA
jgi:aminoglycoside phosphotransferase (APT) family kinase protein